MGMVSRITRRVAALAGYLLGLAPGMLAHASCIPLPDPALKPLDDRIIVNPVSVIDEANAELARTDPKNAPRLAALHAILSESYYQVERDAEAQEAAEDGLVYLQERPDIDQLKVRLILARIVPDDSEAQVEEGLRVSNRILDTLPPATLPYACALLVRARLYQAQNRLDLAVADALTMYRITGANKWREAHALAAEAFGSFYADTTDLDEARRFLNEAIAYAESLKATNWLSVTHYFLGRLDLRAQRYQDAVQEMREAAGYSASVGDQRSVAMSREVICIALTRDGKLREARPECEAAERYLRNTDRVDLYKSAMAARADLDLAMGDAPHALERLNKVLELDGRDLEPRTVPAHYLSRARAFAKLGQYEQAYADLTRYTQLHDAANALDRRRAIAVLRTRFETERAIERSRSLQRENDEQRELLARRAEVTRLWIAVAVVGVAVIALLIFLLRTRQRHAKVLEAQAMILHTMNEGVMLLEKGGGLRCVNAAMEKAFGYERAEYEGLSLQMLGIDTDPRTSPDTGSVPPTIECLLRRKDGSEFPGLVAFTSLAPESPGRFICVIQDITERKRLERELLDVSVREQRHLGQELHDGLGQELTGLSLLARGLAGEARKRELPNAEDLENLSQIASRAIETCRGMARGLSPAGEVQGGLVQALQDLTQRIAQSQGAAIEFHLDAHAPLTLTPEASDHVYRIAQEALNNAFKHAGARHIDVELEVNASKARLEIRDDGCGLDPGAPPTQGLGLRTMRYRANLIGARLSISTGGSPGAPSGTPSGTLPPTPSGTVIVCEWPQLQGA